MSVNKNTNVVSVEQKSKKSIGYYFKVLLIVAGSLGSLATFINNVYPDVLDISKPKFSFKLDRTEAAFLIDHNSNFYSFLFRGTVYNEGPKPLKVREYGIILNYEGRRDTLSTRNMPDSFISMDIRGEAFDKKYYRKNFNLLESQDQIDGYSSYNGWIYCVSPINSIDKLKLAKAMAEGQAYGIMVCRDLHNRIYEYPFQFSLQPREELRPDDK